MPEAEDMSTARLIAFACSLSFVGGCAADTVEVSSDRGGADEGSLECQVFILVNQERADRGLELYGWDSELATAAELHALDMVDNDYFSHVSQDGRSFSDRTAEVGYTGGPRGENIAAGQRSAEQVMTSWMNSDGHRANILAENSNEIGIGHDSAHWVQVFGRGATP